MPVTPTSLADGSQAMTVNTLHVLGASTAPRTTDGIFVLKVDVSSMVAGQSVEFLCSEKVRTSTGTSREAIVGEITGAQGDNDWFHSPPMLVGNGWNFKARQTVGSTGLTLPWSIWQL